METPPVRMPPCFTVNLNQAIYVLSDALDFVGVDDVQHGKRVAYTVLQCADAGLDLTKAGRMRLCMAALIHDIGVSSTEAHRKLINEFEWRDADPHCVTGARLLESFAPLAEMAGIVRHHHTPWNTRDSCELGSQEFLLANLIFLADGVDVLRAQELDRGNTYLDETVQTTVQHQRGKMFAPELVELFLSISSDEDFWARLEPAPLEHYFARHRPLCTARVLDGGEARQLAELFAHVVDAKSPFTYRHSAGVARLSSLLGSKCGICGDHLLQLEIAALLHDLGKLRIPDRILEKTGELAAEDWQRMQRHSLDSQRILERIDGLQAVAEWAGLHHETPCGDGYPFGLRDPELPLEARIISVADVFQALAQERPYRKPLTAEAILTELHHQATLGHLDRGLVELVAGDLENCWDAAVGGPG